MHSQWFKQLQRAIVLLLLLTLSGTAPLGAQSTEPPERLILALFRADIVWSTWAEPHCDLPPSLYVSADASVMERQIREAQAAGIDAFVQTWRGPSMAGCQSAPNFRSLLEQAALVGFAAAAQVDLTSPFLDTTDEVLSALVALGDDLMRRPGYLVLRGRPIVFFLGQQRLSLASWEALRGRVDPGRRQIWIAEGESTATLGVFDGLYVYEPDRSSVPGSQLSQWGSQVRIWERANGTQRFWVATVMPGYDDRLRVGTDSAVVLQRKAGVTYRDEWAAADASDPDWILIRSLNEWERCTHIEPSVAFGDSYLELTAEFADRYRRAVGSATITPPPPDPSATPTPKEPSDLVAPTQTATETAEPSATPEMTPTATLTPTVTPFRLSTPTPSAAPPATQPPTGPQPDAATPEPRRTAEVDVSAAVTPRPRPVVEGNEPRSCTVLPLVLATVCIWGGRRRHGRGASS